MARVDVFFEPGDDVPEGLRAMLDAAGDDPSRVTWVAGSNHVVTDEEVAASYEQWRAEKAKESEAEEEKPAKRARKSAPRKSTAEKENADG